MGSIASAITGSGSKKAATAQADAAAAGMREQKKSLADQIKLMRESLDIQRQMYSDSVEFTSPYRDAGSTAMANYESMLYGIPIKETASYKAASTPSGKLMSTADKESLYISKAKQFLPSTAVLSDSSHRIDAGNAGGQNYTDPKTGTRYMVDVNTGQIMQKTKDGKVSVVPGSEALKGLVDSEVSNFQKPGDPVPLSGIEDPNAVYDYRDTPGYQFRMDEGQKALERSAAARSGVLSGAQIKATQRYGQDYATSEFDNALRRLGGVIDTGANMASGASGQALQSGQVQGGVLQNMADARAGFGNNMSALHSQLGAARASGYLGQQAQGTMLLNNAASIAGGGFGGGGGSAANSSFSNSGWSNWLGSH
jgi:hypothetical protein